LLYLYASITHHSLHTFPTRRSSDLYHEKHDDKIEPGSVRNKSHSCNNGSWTSHKRCGKGRNGNVGAGLNIIQAFIFFFLPFSGTDHIVAGHENHNPAGDFEGGYREPE